MTPERLQEIRKRCDKAVEGPWFTGGPNDGGLTSIEDGRCRGLYTIYAETHEADFIAHARTDVPELLDEIERLEKEATEFARSL